MVHLEVWQEQRKKLRLSLQDIADATEVSISTIKDIFRGKTTDPRIETVQRIEAALGLDAKKITPTAETEGESQWMQLYYVLTDENRALLVKMIQEFERMSPERRRFVLDAIRLAASQK